MRALFLSAALALSCGSAAAGAPAAVGEANVVLRVSLTPSPVAVGALYTSTFRVTNQGPSDAANVLLRGKIAGTDAQGAALPESPIDWSAERRCSGTAGSFRCAFATLRREQSAKIWVRFRSEEPGTHLVSGSVSSSSKDPRPRDNRASAKIRAVARP